MLNIHEVRFSGLLFRFNPEEFSEKGICAMYQIRRGLGTIALMHMIMGSFIINLFDSTTIEQ